MKTSKFLFRTLLVFATLSITIASCKKDKETEEPVDNDTSGAVDNNMAENTSNDIVNIGSQASENSNLTTYKNTDGYLLTCASSVALDTAAKTVTVVFNGTACLDSRIRLGTLVFNYSASTNGAVYFRDPGFSCTVTSSNYYVDGNKVDIISKTITNTTTPVAGTDTIDKSTTNETWTVSANIKITKTNGETITWTCNRTTTLLNTSTVYTNSSTPINWPMARISVSGTASGSRSNGESFSVTATSLVRDFGGCSISGKHPFISGTLDYTPSGKTKRTIDFGNGTCDNVATVSIGSFSTTVTLP